MLRKIATSLVVLVFYPFKLCATEANLPSTITFAVEPAESHSVDGEDPNGFTLAFLASLDSEVKTYACPWARCLKAAQNGEVDILNHLYKTPERETFLTFVYPPYSIQTGEFRLWTRADFTKSIKSTDDLAKLKLAVIRGYVYASELNLDKISDRIEVLTTQQMIEMVLRKRADVFVAPPSLTDEEIKKYDAQGLLMQQPFVFEEKKGVYLAVPKASPWNSHTDYLSEQLTQFLAE